MSCSVSFETCGVRVYHNRPSSISSGVLKSCRAAQVRDPLRNGHAGPNSGRAPAHPPKRAITSTSPEGARTPGARAPQAALSNATPLHPHPWRARRDQGPNREWVPRMGCDVGVCGEAEHVRKNQSYPKSAEIGQNVGQNWRTLRPNFG